MRRGTWVAVAAVTLVIASPFVLNAPLPSGNLREVAHRFAPEGYETVSDGSFEPRRILCLGDNACPSAHILWTFASPFTTKELQAWLDDAGYEATVEGDCARACLADGTADGWQVLVTVRRPDGQSGRAELYLGLKK